MTEVLILKEQNKFVGFVCSGHAGGQPYGQNVFCAGLSALVGSCHLGLEKVLGLAPVWQIDEKKGFFSLKLSQDAQNNICAQKMLETFWLSVDDLAKQSNHTIKVKLKGE